MTPIAKRSFRALGSTPWLGLAAIVSVALGIGANTAIFGLLHALLLEPLPLPGVDRLVAVYTEDRSAAGGPMGGRLPVSHANFEDLRDEGRSFSHLAAWVTTPAAVTAEGGEAERVPAQLVSGEYFAMLGVEARLGRFFTAAEEEAGAAVAVLGHGFWERRLGADRSVVGRTLQVNGAPFEVVGVAPPRFTGTGRLVSPALWLPLSRRGELLSGPVAQFLDSRRGLVLEAAGRLVPGTSPAAAEEELEALGERLRQRHPEANRSRSFTLTALSEAALPPPLRRVVTLAGGLLLAVAGLVLAIACANVAQLLIVRATARRGEMALRLALGEGKGRMLGALFAEGLVLSTAGGVLGIALAYLGSELLWRRRPPMLAVADLDLSPDPAVLAFAAGLVLLTALVFAVVPARQLLRTDLSETLKGKETVDRPGRWWSPGRLLVSAQVALCVVALVGTGLFLVSLDRLHRADPGFDVAATATFAFDPALAGYGPERGRQLARRAVEETVALPGVRSAALGSNLPLGGVPGVFRTIFREGIDVEGGEGTMVTTDSVGHGYFETLGIPLVEGRTLSAEDRADSRLVAVVNRTMAERMWPEGGALDRRFTLSGDDRPRTVVGVVEDSSYTNPGDDPAPYLYLPWEQSDGGAVRVFLRTSGDPAAALGAARGRLRALEPRLPISDAATMEEVASRSLWGPRFASSLLAAFAALALVLMAVGVYGVLAHRVARRRREIGVRVALGADRGSVVRQTLGRGMVPVAVGVAAGLLAAGFLARAIQGVLYQVSTTEPAVFAASAGALLAVALVACWLPARRATRVDPATALRPQ